jgi:serine/threonine protein kinase
LLKVHPKYGKKVDVFAFGVVMWEILTCRSPDMHFDRDQNQLENLCAGRRHSIKPDEMPQTTEGSAFLSLLKRCWETKEGRRPNFAAIVEKLQEMKTQIDDRICNEESK